MPFYQGHCAILYVDGQAVGQAVGEVHGVLLQRGFIEVPEEQFISARGELSCTLEVEPQDPEVFERLLSGVARLDQEGRRLQVLNERHPRRGKGERKRNRKERWR